MSVQLPNGVLLALGTTLAAAKTIASLSNASPPVAGSVAHGYANGDLLVVNSGWSRLAGRIVRAAAVGADVFSYEGIDASNANLYPASTGGGTTRKITAFTQISQVLDLATSGGDMQFASYSFLENDFESQLPTQASAQTLTITIADDPTLAGYIALKAAAEIRAEIPLKLTMPRGDVLLYNGQMSFNETPSMTKNQVMGVKATFSLLSRPVRYAS